MSQNQELHRIFDGMPPLKGEIIRGWREKRKVTQRELAEMLAVKPNTVARWERNAIPIANERLVAIALLFYDSIYKELES